MGGTQKVVKGGERVGPLPPVSTSLSGVPIFVEHWGDDLQFYPNFSLFSIFSTSTTILFK